MCVYIWRDSENSSTKKKKRNTFQDQRYFVNYLKFRNRVHDRTHAIYFLILMRPRPQPKQIKLKT